MKRSLLFSLLVVFCVTFHVNAQCIEVRVISWNMQSGNSDPQTLAAQMAGKGSIDIWGLSEVQNQSTLDVFEQAIEQATGLEYVARLSSKGGADRLAILLRNDRFRIVGDFFQITEIQVGNPGLRPGWAVQLEGKKTGQRFFVVVNHFKCCGGRDNIKTRVKQANALNVFAEAQSEPVLAIGDYNTPFDIFDQEIPAGLQQMIDDGPFQWVKPDVLVGTEDSHSSILDYILVANAIEGWSAKSVILRREENAPAQPTDPFPDDGESTDHRPVLAVFTMDCEERIEALKEEIALVEARLEMLREELKRLQENN